MTHCKKFQNLRITTYSRIIVWLRHSKVMFWWLTELRSKRFVCRIWQKRQIEDGQNEGWPHFVLSNVWMTWNNCLKLRMSCLIIENSLYFTKFISVTFVSIYLHVSYYLSYCFSLLEHSQATKDYDALQVVEQLFSPSYWVLFGDCLCFYLRPYSHFCSHFCSHFYPNWCWSSCLVDLWRLLVSE